MIEAWLEWAVGIVWNYPVVGLCLFAGVFLTLRMFFIQVRCFPHALRLLTGRYDSHDDPGELTHFQALSAALSGTVGLGNIAGVAVAIAMGGPGSIFWMWVIAFVSMTTKYVECALGTIYRFEDPESKRLVGGPMYYLTKGMGERAWPLALFFSGCLALAAFGAGAMFQSNQVALALHKYFAIPNWVTGAGLAMLVGVTIIGGIKRIGEVASRVVPFMCLTYIAGAWLICLLNYDRIPDAVATIVSDAFTGWAAAGGAVGTVIITGVRRAVFSNEAGLGTAPIAHAVVKTRYAIREGIVASLGPFIDTIVVCSATAIVIVLSGQFGTEMYEPISTAKLAVAQGWTLSEDVPPETEALRKFRGEGPALRHDEGARAASMLLEGTDMKTLRFSCYRNEGPASVSVVANGRSASLTLQPGGDSVPGVASITGCPEQPAWHGHIITLNDTAKSVQLSFIPDADSEWIIDRVQPVRQLEGVALTTESFDRFIPGAGSLIIPICIVLFCYSTMITWSYYGETGASYLFGNRAILPYRILFVLATFLGTLFALIPLLNFTDLVLGLMIIPNFIGILYLSGRVVTETRDYFAKLKSGHFD